MSTDRIYQRDDDKWYFNIRGDQAMGPYESYHEAERALSEHVSHYRSRTDGKVRLPRIFQPSRLRRSAPRHT